MMTLSYIVEHQDVPARLDYSERNDQMRYPDGAYIGKDYHLLRLALVSEVTPRVNKKYCTVTPASQGPLSVSYLPDLEWVEVVDRYNGSRRLVAIVRGTVLQYR